MLLGSSTNYKQVYGISFLNYTKYSNSYQKINLKINVVFIFNFTFYVYCWSIKILSSSMFNYIFKLLY